MRLRATLTVEYDADPDSYGTDDPQKAAEIDLPTWRDDPAFLLDAFGSEGWTITVEPVAK